MAVKRGKLLSLSTTNSKSSSTVASDTSSNKTKYQIELWKKTKQEEISTTIKRRKWSWIGHTLRKDLTNTTKQALDYNPQGKRRQGRPKINWRRSTLQDLDKVGVTWQEAKALAQKRVRWRNMVDALCS